jgi:hypothetical protein
MLKVFCSASQLLLYEIRLPENKAKHDILATNNVHAINAYCPKACYAGGGNVNPKVGYHDS